MPTKPFWEEDSDVLVEEDIDSGTPAQIIVFNDDHNSFDHVIESFIDILQHSSTQAEQLALIIHFKGKATVKSGPKNTLRPLKDGLVDRGLSAVIEDLGD